jgi:sulfur-oxidizing protein SoxY
MTQIDWPSALNRRQFAVAAAATAVLALVPGLPALSQEQPEAKPWEAMVKKILGEAKPVEGKLLTIDMAEIAENGNTVPFTLSVDSPMTDKDYVKALHLISTANPRPEVVVFRFTPACGVAKAESRMRLVGTQDVIAIAELSDGKFLMARRPVKVTVGGCGG